MNSSAFHMGSQYWQIGPKIAAGSRPRHRDGSSVPVLRARHKTPRLMPHAFEGRGCPSDGVL